MNKETTSSEKGISDIFRPKMRALPEEGKFMKSQIGELFGISTDYVETMLKKYEIKHHKFGKNTVIDIKDIWKATLVCPDPSTEKESE